MAFALRLFLLLLLAVALPDRAAQASPQQAQGAEWNHDLDYLEVMINGGLKTLPDAGAKPLGEGGLAFQPTSSTEALGDGEGVSAGRTFPAPEMVTARKPGSHRRGPPRGNAKTTGPKKPQYHSKTMQQMLKEMLQGAQEKDQRALLKAALSRGSSGSLAVSSAGREAMPGTVTKEEVPGKVSPLHWLHKVVKPLEPPAGVSAGRTFPAPRLFTAHKPSSHRRGPLRRKSKAPGKKGSLESHDTLKQIMKELHKGHGVDREALWKVAFPEAREAIAGTGPGTGGMKQKAVHKEAPPGGSSVSLATPDSGREAIAGRGPDTGDAVTTTRVPDSQKGIRMSFCQGTRCWLVIMAGLLCLVLFFILCCFGIWYICQRKQCVSAASQILPKTSAGKSCIGYRPSPSQYLTSLPPLHYQLIVVEVQPPCRTGPSAPAGAGPGVLPGLKVGPSCQGRA